MAEATNTSYQLGVKIQRWEVLFLCDLGFDFQIDEFMIYCRSRELRAKTLESYEHTLRLFERWCREELNITQVDQVTESVKEFSNGLMFPSDPSGGAAEVINCRCTSNTRARWALDDGELQTLKECAEYFGLDKTKNFEEYKQKYLKAVENSENDGIILARSLLTHRRTADSGREIINQATYHKLTNPVLQKGGTIITATADNDWMRYLDDRSATAVTIGDTIIFRADATTTEVLEEVYHFNQNRAGLNNQYSAIQRMIMNEIDAHEYLISVADKYKIPQAEREETKALLESYKKQMEELKKAGEWDD